MNAAEMLKATTETTKDARPMGNLSSRNKPPFDVDGSFRIERNRCHGVSDSLHRGVARNGSPRRNRERTRSRRARLQMQRTIAIIRNTPIQRSERPSESADPVTSTMKYRRPRGKASQTYATFPYVRGFATTPKNRRTKVRKWVSSRVSSMVCLSPVATGRKEGGFKPGEET